MTLPAAARVLTSLLLSPGGLMSEHRAMMCFPGAFGSMLAARLDLPAEIADKCPVHRTLRSEIRIVTRLSP